eukprot:COSAG06_NODE_8052_length_2287_cov_12.388026_4_plen_193_part_00
MTDTQDAAAEFGSMDENGGGVVLFDEFCAWALRRHIEVSESEEQLERRQGVVDGQEKEAAASATAAEGSNAQPSQPQEKEEEEDEKKEGDEKEEEDEKKEEDEKEEEKKKPGLRLSKERRIELEPLRRKLISMSYGGGQGADPGVLFNMYDRDNNGQLDFREFSNAVRKGVSTAAAATAAAWHITRAQCCDR